jgi:hypothetical protein
MGRGCECGDPDCRFSARPPSGYLPWTEFFFLLGMAAVAAAVLVVTR